ncbi:MAG: glycoside hydrolase family 3 N-terminal domain-containing protein [bacterium]|nr:glycoside hydrolase family 3 N-terminal domain-containing protein [bacterium]
MNREIIFYLFFLGVFVQCNVPKKDSNAQKAKALLGKMTLEEKAGQMTQLTIEMISAGELPNLAVPHALDTAKLRKVIVEMGVGSILNVGGYTYTRQHWKEIMTAIHAYEKMGRLQVPVLYGIDAIHGANYTVGATLYPQQISLASSFNKDLAKQMAQMVSNDVRASGISWNFSPVLDVARNPMWPRFWETFGEDPYVVSEMGVAMVEGYQAPQSDGKLGVAACLKHYLGYGDPRSGKDRTPAYIAERQLREIVLPPFEKAVAAGAKTIMINSSEINGEPVHASKFLLRTILRDELKFTGVTVTDWEDIKNLRDRHHVAATYKEAVAMAINAGIDLAMVPLDYEFTQYLIENVKEGKVQVKLVDEAVYRILVLKLELGLFDEASVDMDLYENLGSEKSKQLSYELATQSIVLLKNKDNLLPLKPNEKILVTGANAHYINAMNGGWTHTWQGRDPQYNTAVITPLMALENVFGKEQVTYLPGNTYTACLTDLQLLAAAKDVKTVVLFLGEDTYTEKPGDINRLEMEEAQQNLIKVYAKAGKKIVLVLLQGRPRTFETTEPLCDAIFFAGLPGNEGGRALAELIVGKVNPSAKLPFTYPRYEGVHTTYDCKYSEVLNNDFKPIGFNPLFHFGSGLSYTQFEYTDLQIEKRDLRASDSVEIRFNLSNTGDRMGTETVLIYSKDLVASITPSVKKLRSFKRVDLAPKETKAVAVKIPVSQLRFVDVNNKWLLEPGTFYFEVSQLRDSINLQP